MVTFKAKNPKYITFESVGLRMTKKEFEEARGRYAKFSESLDKKFPNMRRILKEKDLQRLPEY